MPAKRVEIAQANDYLGHWQGGYTLTQEDLEAMVRNLRGPVVIDYEHATQWAEPGAPVPAAGWVSELEVSGTSLFGPVTWTDRAAGMIDADEYRYLSPVIDLWAADPISGRPIGAKLLSIALTNTPFMEGMAPVTNAARPVGQLGRLLAANTALVLNNKQPGGAPASAPTTPTNPTPQMEPKDTGLRAFLNRVGQRLGMSGQPTDEVDVLLEADRLRANSAAATDLQTQLTTAQARVAELEAENATLKAGAEAQVAASAEAQATADAGLLDQAVADFKIPAAERDAWAERLNTSREATTAVLNSIPKDLLKGPQGLKPPASGAVANTQARADAGTRRANAAAAFKK